MTKNRAGRVEKVILSGDIDEATVGEVIYELFRIERKGKADRIELWMSTYGGSVNSGFALIDAIEQLKIPVDIVASGTCMSMGTHILQAGDRRYATPNTRIMIHPMSTGYFGNLDEGKVEMRESKQLEKSAMEQMAKRVGMSVKELKRFQGRIRYMSPDEAKKHNFIDGIRRPPKR